MVLRQKDQSHTPFLACFKKPTNWLFMHKPLSWIVSFMPIFPSWIFSWLFLFFLEKHYIPQCYRWLTSWVCARLCQCDGQSGCYFECDKPCTCSYTRTPRFSLPRSSCAYLNSFSEFGFLCLNQTLKINVGSGQVWASKRGPFATLSCIYHSGSWHWKNAVLSNFLKAKGVHVLKQWFPILLSRYPNQGSDYVLYCPLWKIFAFQVENFFCSNRS